MSSRNTLRKACKSGNIKSVNRFLKRTQDWNSGLYGACEGGHMDLVELMISKGANEWHGAMGSACHGGNLEIVKLIAPKTDRYGSLQYGLREACLAGHFEIVKYLFSKGAYFTNDALYAACIYGNLEIVKFLALQALQSSQGSQSLNNNCDYDIGLYGACVGGHVEIARFMISRGSHKWPSALKCAQSVGALDVVHLLISKATAAGGAINLGYKWPKHKSQIVKLLYLGTPLEKFIKIKGYPMLKEYILDIKQSILDSNVLLPDLVKIISKCIVA